MHQETEETYTRYIRREKENTEEVQNKRRKQRKAGKVQQVIDGGGFRWELLRGQGGANRARSEKNPSMFILVLYRNMLPVQRYRLPGVPGTLDSLGGKH